MKDLTQKFNQWLAEHLTPARAASGSISRRRGLVRYEDTHRLNRLLGGSLADAAELVRKGERPAPHVRRAVEELVDRWDIPQVLQLRRDQALARDLRQAVTHKAQFGHAPDGGSLNGWARRVRARHERLYETEAGLGGEAFQLWSEIFEVSPANIRRRERRAA
ncbi:MAG: hypothetical protein ACLFVJ_20515 [Persicimonas sp.]